MPKRDIAIIADEAIEDVAIMPAKVGRPSLYTPEVHQKIVQYIRAGAYEWVAAEAAGVSQTTFHRWLRAGKVRKSSFWQFRQDVLKAGAEARVLAETEVRKTDPFKWLRFGPGREREGRPGWTDSTDVNVKGELGITWHQFVKGVEGDGDTGSSSE